MSPIGVPSLSTAPWPAPRLVYHRRYNIGLLGLERFHPFDSRKYGRAWKELRRQFGRELNRFWVKPPRPISRPELLAVHSEAYLLRLRDSRYVNLDAHQGNGVCRMFQDDPRFFIYDQYNREIFQRRIDCDVPMANGCREADYLGALRSRLPAFLDALTKHDRMRLAIYNAGTDIYAKDQLGGFNVSKAGVLERDQFVLRELIGRQIPTSVVLSGGYSRESYQLVADMVSYVLRSWGGVRQVK